MFLFESSQDKRIRQDVQNQMMICLRSPQQKNQDKYKKSMQIISKYIQNNNQKVIQSVIDNIKTTIKDQQYEPVRKYQSIKLLRDLMKIQMKNKNKSLGKYVVKKILKRLTILASHKSNSNDQDRGKDIFKNVKRDQEKYSILFLNQLLLSIQQWAKTWPGTSDGTKKQFNEAYKDLITSGVQFPKQIVKAPIQQPYRPQQANRNSLGFNNGTKKDSKQKQSLRRQQKSPISEIRPKIQQKQIKPIKKVSSDTINDKKLKDHFENVVSTLNLVLQTLNGSQQIDSQILDLIKALIYELSQLIAKGNEFVAQTPQQQWKNNQDIVKILQTFEFDKSINKDIKKAQKNPTQFNPFRKKYTKMGKLLIQSLTQTKKIQKNLEQSNVQSDLEKSQIKKPNQSISPQEKLRTKSQPKQIKNSFQNTQMSTAKKLSIPKVRQQNRFSSNSGLQNNWVIKQKSQYNSNSHKDQHQSHSHQKFGSFGIGGIGQKVRIQDGREKEKSKFANNKSHTQRQQKFKRQEDKSHPTTQKNITQNQQSQQPPKVLKNIPKVVDTSNKTKNKQTKPVQFNAFQLSSQNKQKKHQQFYFDQPTSTIKQGQKKQIKQKHQRTKDMFNDSDFKLQVKVQKQRQQQQKSNKDDSQDNNFFGQFGAKNNQRQQLPMGQRNPRRQRTAAGTTKNIQQNGQNPFQTHSNNNNADDSANNFSAFQKDKSSLQITKSKGPNFYDQSTLKNNNQKQQQRKQSYDNPFDKSLQLNKSNLTTNRKNSFDDRNPNFWEASNSHISKTNKVQNPFKQSSINFNQAKNSVNQDQKSDNKSRRSVNPFQNEEGIKKSVKSINPFEDDNKSQLSNKDRSSIRNFTMNQSFTKSEKSNPFETTSQNMAKKRIKTQNPFKQSQIQGQKQQFKPESIQRFQSVSQRASFKKITGQKTKDLDLSIENPFETTKPKIQPNKNRDSLKLSVESQQKNQEFDFDQFQNIGGNRQSVQTSNFPQRRNTVQSNKSNPFNKQNNPFENKNSIQNNIKNSLQQKSIHFSQFGDQNNQSFHQNNNVNKQNDKSLNFSDFDNIANNQNKNKNDSGLNFSAFQNNQNNSKQQQNKLSQKSNNNKNQFSAFQVSKTSGNDFFRQTQRQDKKSQKGIDDNKSRHSGFSGFNMNFQNKSQQKLNKSGVDWNQFQGFQKDPKTSKVLDVKQSNLEGQFQMNTQRSQQIRKQFNAQLINKNQLKLNFSQNTSKYHSPQFAVKYESISIRQQNPINSMLTSQRQKHSQFQIRQSIKLQQFMSIQKKGYEWNPIGIPVQHQLSRIYNVTDYDLQQKKKQVQYYKQNYIEQKGNLQHVKQIYNKQRKKYILKIQKINEIINQKQSYKKILISLKQSNHNKEQQMFIMNEKIRQIQKLKQKILQKQKQLFQKSKQFIRQQQENKIKGRTNTNKWQIFNRNIKMLRQRQQQQNQSYSKQNYSYMTNNANNNGNITHHHGKSFNHNRA